MPDAREDKARFPAFIEEVAARFHAFSGRDLDARDPYLEIIQIYFILQDVLFQRSEERMAEFLRRPEKEGAGDAPWKMPAICCACLVAGAVLGFILGRL